jgi:hypothetical protein
MGERERYTLATTAAESMYNLWELEHEKGELDLDRMMRRLKDLSTYSLTHGEIMEGREGVELLALAMFFGASSNPQFHRNQVRLRSLSQETIDYQGQAEDIEGEMKRREPDEAGKAQEGSKAVQPKLL